MANIYDIRRYGKVAFLLTSALLAAIFIYYSNSLVRNLSAQERERMEIWADATKEIINISASDDAGAADLSSEVDFLIGIIESNTTIPVLLTDSAGNILQHRNFSLPDPIDPQNPLQLSAINEAYLKDKLASLAGSTNVIHITIAPGVAQHLYYEDSTLLKSLSRYPYVLLLVMVAFIIVVYFAVLSTKKAEQNKVWVGLSKETAHQLGTPISSLMAWMQLLPEMGVDRDTVAEMDKDVRRLSTIASRFSKVGSTPKLEPDDLNVIVERSAAYMKTRISRRISLTTDLCNSPLPVEASAPLLEWVMENLIKNAVDAMTDSEGRISVSTFADRTNAVVEVTDTGRGMSRKTVKNIFNPGFTTKTRGWGLGLTLAARIIKQYHHGDIFVKASAPGQGTTFRIEIPLLP